MTDERIIDGVNVAECEFYNSDDETCREENSKYSIDICEFTKCEGCSCYYKQLARKTQECEELRNNFNIEHAELLSARSKIEELKGQLNKVYEDIKLSPLCYKCSEEDCLTKEIDKLKIEKEQAEQKIERIKTLANTQCSACKEFSSEQKNNL